MNYLGYSILPDYIKEGKLDWHNPTGNGPYVVGVKSGFKWMIKRRRNILLPASTDSKVLRKSKEESVKRCEEMFSNLAGAITKGFNITFDKDGIAFEEELLKDKKNNWIISVSRFIENAHSLVDLHGIINDKDFIECCLGVSRLIEKIHSHKIIHADLKPENIVFTNNGVTRYYLVDFDCSIVEGKEISASEMVYTEGYQSPEVAIFIDEEPAKADPPITVASDIFSLGIIFHLLKTKVYPKPSGGLKCSIGEAIAMGKSIDIDEEMKLKIGKYSFYSLLNWMFAFDVTKRANISQVIEVLEDRGTIPSEYLIKDDIPLFDEPWKEDKIVLAAKDVFDRKGVKSLTKVEIRGKKRYKITIGSTSFTVGADYLIDNGYAIKK